MAEKIIQKLTVISSLNKENSLLPVDRETLRQLSFTEPIKKSNIKPINEEIILRPKNHKINSHGRFCAVSLWLTILMLIFLILQAILFAILFSQCK